MPIFLIYICIFLLGVVVGSFLNVCILRIPAGESIVTTPSHCPKCGKRLKWFELIPLFSYIFLGGKCSGCKEHISAQYPIVEAANGLLWVLVTFVMGLEYMTICACLLTSALLVIAVIDWRTMEIPFGLSLAVLVLGAAATLLDLDNWLDHIIGLFAISVPLLLIFLITRGRGIGGGDIKLMAGCGLFLGWQLVVLGFFLGCVLGTVIHLARMAVKKAGRQLSFGPYLALGCFLSMLWGAQAINWYLGLW